MSDWFTKPTDLAPNTRARSESVNARMTQVDDAFALFPGRAELFERRFGLVTDTGAADAYVVTLAPVPSTYTLGMQVFFTPTNTNTGASTINVNALGAKSIKRYDGTVPQAGDLTNGRPVTVTYDGTSFLLPLSTSATIGALPDGAVGTPSLAFATDLDTGIYRIGANNMGIAAAGAKVLDIGTTGLAVTGAFSVSDAATTRSNLGVEIGVDVLAQDDDLDDIAALPPLDGRFIVGDGSNWTAETGSTARTSIGLGALDTATFAEVLVDPGSAAAPSIAFEADPDSGIYRIGADNWGLAANGAQVVDVSTAGVDVTGVVKRSGNDLAWEELASADGSTSSANADVDFSSVALSNYQAVKIIIDEILLQTDGADLQGQISQSSTYRLTANYFGGNTINGTPDTTYGPVNTITLFPNAEIGSNDEGIFGEINLRMYGAKRPVIRHELAGGQNDAVPLAMVVGVSKWNSNTGFVDRFRFKASTGNIERWAIRVIGLPK